MESACAQKEKIRGSSSVGLPCAGITSYVCASAVPSMEGCWSYKMPIEQTDLFHSSRIVQYNEVHPSVCVTPIIRSKYQLYTVMIIFNGGMVLTFMKFQLNSCLYLPEDSHISGRNVRIPYK